MLPTVPKPPLECETVWRVAVLLRLPDLRFLPMYLAMPDVHWLEMKIRNDALKAFVGCGRGSRGESENCGVEAFVFMTPHGRHAVRRGFLERYRQQYCRLEIALVRFCQTIWVEDDVAFAVEGEVADKFAGLGRVASAYSL